MSELSDNVAASFKECNEQRKRIAALTAEVKTLKAQLAEAQTPTAAPTPAYPWICFHCDFKTFDKAEAEAHFGSCDDAGEFTPLCKWWSNMDDQERKEQFQSLIQELNQERMRDDKRFSQVRDQPAQVISKACSRGNVKNGCSHCFTVNCRCECHKRSGKT